MDSLSDIFNNSNNQDINDNPLYTPILNESNYYFHPLDEPYDNSFEFNRFEQNSDDNLLSVFPFDNKENNFFDAVNLPMKSFEPANRNIPNEAMSTEAATKMHVNHEIRTKKTCPIFEIKKDKKTLLGRRKRNRIYLNEAGHNKFEKKNILTKNKKRAYNSFLELFNKNIKDSKDEEIKKRKIKLRKVNNSVIEVSSKYDNLKLIKMKMKDILSQPLSNNHKKIDKNYNKKAIDFILKRKDEKLISMLDKSFEDVIRIYADDLIDKNFDGFKTIEYDVKKIKDHLKDNPDLELEEMDYIKTYIQYAKNFKQTYMDIKERNPKKKKIN
jgi:hypothetical protein